MGKIFNRLSNIVDNYLEKKEGLQKYQQVLTYFLNDGAISESESAQLAYLEDKYSLGKKDIRKSIVSSLKKYFERVMEDQKITESERLSLEALLNYFEILPQEVGFNQALFNKCYALGLIDEGRLPVILPENYDINIIFKKKEQLHFGAVSSIWKLKTAVTHYNYGGLTGSIKIMKGVRFRVGSIAVKPQKHEFFEIEDTGVFYITNQRIGFIGDRKHFSISFDKVSSFNLTENGVFIFKSGREKPYIITMDDYDVPLAMVSFLLNT